VTRLLLAGLGVVEVSWGVWAYLAPRGFFDTFPGAGHHWTAAYPPYNEHLVSDLGATFLTLGALALVAAWLDDRRVIVVVLGAQILFNALHLTFHATHRGDFAADYPVSLFTLALGVILPSMLLASYRRRR
jgi:hypothetical protein